MHIWEWYVSTYYLDAHTSANHIIYVELFQHPASAKERWQCDQQGSGNGQCEHHPCHPQGWEWQVGFPSSPMWRWSIQYIPQVIPYAALTVDGCLWYHVILCRCFKALSTTLWILLVRRSIRQKMPRTIANKVLSIPFQWHLKQLHGSEIIAGEVGCHQVPAFHCATCLIF